MPTDPVPTDPVPTDPVPTGDDRGGPDDDGRADRALEPGDRPHEYVAGGADGRCAVCGHDEGDALHDPINRPTTNMIDQLAPADREEVEMVVADALLYGHGRLERDGTRLRRVSANDPQVGGPS